MSKALKPRPAPTCFLCGGPNANRKINYNKADGNTGRLVVCDDCADAMPTEKDEDGEWTLTVELDGAE